MGNNLADRESGFFYGWVVLGVCFFLGVIAFGLNFSFGIFFKSLESDFHLTRATTSAIFSVFLLVSPVVGLIGGWINDKYGPRLILSVMGLFTGAGLLMLSRASETWHLFFSYSLLLAVGNGGVFPIVMAVASKWFVRRRGLAIGIVGCGISVGILVMSPISAFLISGFGWRQSYFILALVGFLLMAPLAWLLKTPPGERVLKTINSKSPAVEQFNNGPVNTVSGMTVREAARTRELWLFVSLWTLYSVGIYIITGHIVRHAIDLGIPEVKAAIILTILGGASAAARLLMGRLSDSIGRRQSILGGALLMAAAMLWLMFSTDLWQLYLFGALFGVAYGGFSTPVTALIGDTFGTRHLGVIIGIAGAGWCLGGAAGPALAGYIFDTTGSYFFGFLIGVITSLISAGLVFLFKEGKEAQGALR